MWTDATSPLGYAVNTSGFGFKGWSSQRRRLSSNIKLKLNAKQGCSERCSCVKANLFTKLSNQHLLQKSHHLGYQNKLKKSSCNLLLLNNPQAESVFCQSQLINFVKDCDPFFSNLKWFTVLLPFKWYNFLPLNYSSVFPPRKAVN